MLQVTSFSWLRSNSKLLINPKTDKWNNGQEDKGNSPQKDQTWFLDKTLIFDCKHSLQLHHCRPTPHVYCGIVHAWHVNRLPHTQVWICIWLCHFYVCVRCNSLMMICMFFSSYNLVLVCVSRACCLLFVTRNIKYSCLLVCSWSTSREWAAGPVFLQLRCPILHILEIFDH